MSTGKGVFRPEASGESADSTLKQDLHSEEAKDRFDTQVSIVRSVIARKFCVLNILKLIGQSNGTKLNSRYNQIGYNGNWL